SIELVIELFTSHVRCEREDLLPRLAEVGLVLPQLALCCVLDRAQSVCGEVYEVAHHDERRNLPNSRQRLDVLSVHLNVRCNVRLRELPEPRLRILDNPQPVDSGLKRDRKST